MTGCEPHASRRWTQVGVVGSVLVLILSLTLPSDVAAQGEESGSDSTRSGSWWDLAIASVSLQAGKYEYDPVPDLPGLHGQTTAKLGISIFPGPPFPSWVWGFDFHVWGINRSYTSVLEGAAESETELTSNGFGLGTRAGLPVSSPIGIYALGGFTYVDHVMEVEMLPAWFMPNFGNSREEEGGGWSPYWGLALDVRIKDFAVGVEQRWVRTHATFDEPFSMHDLPLGGSTLFIGLTWYGGRTAGGLRSG